MSSALMHSTFSQFSPLNVKIGSLLDHSIYARTMYQHTKKQIDAASQLAKMRSPIDVASDVRAALATEYCVSGIEGPQNLFSPYEVIRGPVVVL